MIFRLHPETAIYDKTYFDPQRFDLWAEIQEHLIPTRLDFIANLLPQCNSIRLLEVGGGRGSLVKHLVARGWQWSIVEPSPAARTYLENTFSTNVYPCVDDVPERMFDVIHLNHVLEHITTPVTSLQTMRRRLKPGGLIWVEVPQEIMSYRVAQLLQIVSHNSRAAERMFDPAHAVLYTKTSLRLVLQKAGFENVRISWVGWRNKQRFAAFTNRMPWQSKALATLCKYSGLDYLMKGGWLNAVGSEHTI